MIMVIVDKETNTVENVIVWDGISEWSPPENKMSFDVTNLAVGIGYIYDPANNKFSMPPELADQDTTLPGTTPQVIG